jgi:adenylate cyclase
VNGEFRRTRSVLADFASPLNAVRCAVPFQTRRSRLYQIAAEMALGETDQAQKLARAALAAQPDLSVKYVRGQEWYRDQAVLEKLVQRLIQAGIPSGICRAPQ